jgi:hypothetical protein
MNWSRVNDQNLVRQRDLAWAPQETLGSREVCWCGQPQNHEWPGKSDGAEHPKAAGARSAEHLGRDTFPRFKNGGEGLTMARLKDDGEFQVEGTVTMWLPVESEEGERLVVNSSQEIWPQQVWVSVSLENENWAVGSVIVKGRLYRKDNTVGERWGERMYSGPLDDGEFEGPEWLVAVLEKEISRRVWR